MVTVYGGKNHMSLIIKMNSLTLNLPIQSVLREITVLLPEINNNRHHLKYPIKYSYIKYVAYIFVITHLPNNLYLHSTKSTRNNHFCTRMDAYTVTSFITHRELHSNLLSLLPNLQNIYSGENDDDTYCL